MKVIATAEGFHGKVRYPGETFEVADDEKGSWFVPVDKPAARSAQTSGAAKASEAAKAKAEADAKAKAEAAAKAGGQGGGNDLV